MIATSGPISYRPLRSGGYETLDDWWCDTGIVGHAARLDGAVALDNAGRLTIHEGWPWDGPSGPTKDTPSFMRGSLAHDALYILLRAGKLVPSLRKVADKLLYQLCRQDGMGWFRAQYVYLALRLGAGFAAKRQLEPEAMRLRAP